MHRFIPAWTAIATSPKRIAIEIVQHHPRNAGKSKYGISRSFRVIDDIGTRPLLLVGVVSLISSLQFLTTGVVAELMARTYFESSMETQNCPIFQRNSTNRKSAMQKSC
jgi:hypothetical protein